MKLFAGQGDRGGGDQTCGTEEEGEGGTLRAKHRSANTAVCKAGRQRGAAA